MDHGVQGDRSVEIGFLRRIGQFAMQQEIADLEKTGLFGELINGIAPVKQDASIAIDVGDFRLAGGGGNEPGIEGEIPLPREAGYVNDFWPFRARQNGQFDGILAVNGQQGFLRHGWLLVIANRGARGNASDAPCACQRDFCPGQNRARSPALRGKTDETRLCSEPWVTIMRTVLRTVRQGSPQGLSYDGARARLRPSEGEGQPMRAPIFTCGLKEGCG